MKTIFSGPRHIPPAQAIALVREAILACPWVDDITSVVHGAAKGIDAAADVVCRERWEVEKEPADWDKHGKPAGAIRNQKMALGSKALIAIWDGASPGTKNMIETARGYGLRVYVHRFRSPQTPAAGRSGFGVT